MLPRTKPHRAGPPMRPHGGATQRIGSIIGVGRVISREEGWRKGDGVPVPLTRTRVGDRDRGGIPRKEPTHSHGTVFRDHSEPNQFSGVLLR